MGWNGYDEDTSKDKIIKRTKLSIFFTCTLLTDSGKRIVNLEIRLLHAKIYSKFNMRLLISKT